ncbi:iron-containing redox enzyme family protein [Streptomyces sp. B1866]|uniref:iron-containing redox enzyme family protein n=1 Tax=Streptomyces sp. B1866 TaxID=3075431 RepID=UPI00288CD5E2|nr:iron-containing redox enzyme family protein [Streptomyces sp. B1866]MDT3400397.1 iron-containing redox enzyme family protein [Streptomyces sp. B1866]
MLAALAGPVRTPAPPLPTAAAGAADPLGDDAQLALYACYELHYRGFAGVADDWEWQPDLLRLRQALEERFLAALRAAVPGGADAAGALDALLAEPPGATGVSHRLHRHGTWEQAREFLAHRSLYQLKEADPQAWLIPRLTGQAKASLVAVEFDEYGAGRGERVHARLFADAMSAAGLDPAYGRYLDHAPAATLATVNLMSLLGLRRSLRGAMAGHFAALEITSSPGAQRLAAAFGRLGAAAACVRFFTEHIGADAVHEQLMRRDVVGGLLDREPGQAAAVVFGVQATTYLEDRWAARVLADWDAGRTSLRRPLEAPGRPEGAGGPPTGPG